MQISDDLIIHALRPYGVNVTPDLCSKIRAYVELLLRWNQKISLTTVTNPEEILRFHFGESVFSASAMKIERGRLADVGTGAGFPGLPLKLVRPEIDLFLIESNARKVVFLREAVRAMSLDGVEVLHVRMEDLAAADPPYDFVTARAVGNFEELLGWAAGRIAPTGRVVLWVGEEDMRAVSKLPGWNWSEPVHIPGSKSRYLQQGSMNR